MIILEYFIKISEVFKAALQAYVQNGHIGTHKHKPCIIHSYCIDILTWSHIEIFFEAVTYIAVAHTAQLAHLFETARKVFLFVEFIT